MLASLASDSMLISNPFRKALFSGFYGSRRGGALWGPNGAFEVHIRPARHDGRLDRCNRVREPSQLLGHEPGGEGRHRLLECFAVVYEALRQVGGDHLGQFFGWGE